MATPKKSDRFIKHKMKLKEYKDKSQFKDEKEKITEEQHKAKIKALIEAGILKESDEK